MALKNINYMSSQQGINPSHTKIVEVLRSKSHKKHDNDQRQNLYFKIKPGKAHNELIITYNDLKNNFPYALLDYYETKIKIKNQNSSITQALVNTNEQKVQKLQNKIKIQSRQNLKKTLNENPQKQKQLQENNKENQKETKCTALFDYDHYLKLQYQKGYPTFKQQFFTMFSKNPVEENHYLKDLPSQEVPIQFPKRNVSSESNYQSKRKKARIDYTQ